MNESEFSQFLLRHAETVIVHPKDRDVTATVPEAITDCHDPETDRNHLLEMLLEASVEDAETIIADHAPRET